MAFFRKRMYKNNLFFIPEINIYVNLENVTYIKFDRKKLKIIFSYDYSIRIKNVLDANGNQKIIPDYTYYHLDDLEHYNLRVNELIKYIEDNTDSYHYYKDGTCEYLINFSKISSIKFRDNRVIINFNHSASFMDEEGEYQTTSFSIYIDVLNFNIPKFKTKINEDVFDLS